MRLPLVLTALLALASLTLSRSTPSAFTISEAAADPTTVTTAPATTAPVPPTTVTPPTTAPPPAAPAPPTAQAVLPSGTGMWIWVPEKVYDGDANATVAWAKQMGISHLFVKTGSSFEGPLNGMYLRALLPVAHAAGIRVYGWDFPTFTDLAADLQRAMMAVTFLTPDGHRLDGFSPDIETASEGVNLNAELAGTYARTLRQYAGPHYPLIATVPRPSDSMIASYPYADVLAPMDAVAPMVYWLNRQPDSDVAGAMHWLSQFGKPIMPIGQAYDGGPEGGRDGNPTYEEISRFITTAAQFGAAAVSFWSWQHASLDDWAAIQQSSSSAPALAPGGLPPVVLPPPIG